MSTLEAHLRMAYSNARQTIRWLVQHDEQYKVEALVAVIDALNAIEQDKP